MLSRQSVSVLYHTTELVARFKGERDDFLKPHNVCFSRLKQYREILLRLRTSQQVVGRVRNLAVRAVFLQHSNVFSVTLRKLRRWDRTTVTFASTGNLADLFPSPPFHSDCYIKWKRVFEHPKRNAMFTAKRGHSCPSEALQSLSVRWNAARSNICCSVDYV